MKNKRKRSVVRILIGGFLILNLSVMTYASVYSSFWSEGEFPEGEGGQGAGFEQADGFTGDPVQNIEVPTDSGLTEETRVRTEYTYEDPTLTATAVMTDASLIPDDAVLRVTRILPGSDYDIDAYLKALNAYIQGKAAEEGVSYPVYTIDNTLLYDIGFYNNEELLPEPYFDFNNLGLFDPAYLPIQQDGSGFTSVPVTFDIAKNIRMDMNFNGEQLTTEIGAEITDELEVLQLPQVGQYTPAKLTDPIPQEILLDPSVPLEIPRDIRVLPVLDPYFDRMIIPAKAAFTTGGTTVIAILKKPVPEVVETPVENIDGVENMEEVPEQDPGVYGDGSFEVTGDPVYSEIPADQVYEDPNAVPPVDEAPVDGVPAEEVPADPIPEIISGEQPPVQEEVPVEGQDTADLSGIVGQENNQENIGQAFPAEGDVNGQTGVEAQGEAGQTGLEGQDTAGPTDLDGQDTAGPTDLDGQAVEQIITHDQEGSLFSDQGEQDEAGQADSSGDEIPEAQQLGWNEDVTVPPVTEEDSFFSSPVEYTYEDDVVSVKAVPVSADAVPEDAEFVVTPITRSSSDYNYDAYMDALNSADESSADGNGFTGTDASSDANATAKYSEENTLLYDIAFYVDELDEEGQPTGRKVEFFPAEGSVLIDISYKENDPTAITPTENDADKEILHLALKDEVLDQTDSTREATNITADDIQVENVTPAVS